MAQDIVLTLALQSLYPPHPLAHSRLLELKGTEKCAPVIKRAATTADYLEHLAPDSYDGVGALGMYPGLSVGDGQGKKRWYVSYFAVDFDANLTYDVEPLAHTLEGEGIPTYLTVGTTGRGSHLYGFVEGLGPQWKLYRVVKTIQTMAEDAGLGLPEIRPSCELGRGSPIFLPYRGALKDGYGFNPLLDPRRDLEPVKLEQALTEVQRIPYEALEKFRLNMVQQRPIRAKSPTTALVHASGGPGTTCKLEGEDGLSVLRAEFGRVAEHFKEPHRQDVVMALTAYGVRGLGLGPATVRDEVTTFVKQHGADELVRRLEAVERTLTKYAANPRTIAWTPFYRSAGLTPPGKLGVSKGVLARLEWAARLLHSGAWKGASGLSDRSVFIALLRVGSEHGMLHPSGVLVSVSVRDLALRSGVGDKTVRNAIKRLKAREMVARERRTNARAGEAGLLLIVVGGVPELPHSFPLIGGLKEWGHLYTHAAFRHGKLGKSAAPLLVSCLQEGRPLTRPELAKLLGRASQSIRNPLQKLLNHDIISELDARYVLNPHWEDALEHAATVTGAFQTEERQRASHEAERIVFSARLRGYASGDELEKAA